MTIIEPAPTYVSLAYTEGAATFDIIVEAENLVLSSTVTVGVVIELVNYPELPKLYSEFTVVVNGDAEDLTGLPAFAEELQMKELDANAGISWQLPEIIENDYPLDKVIVEPAAELESLI